MKNQHILNKIESLINKLKEIQLSNNTAITELEEIKGEILPCKGQPHSTEAEPREGTNSTSTPSAVSIQDTNPDTQARNMGMTQFTHHTDRRGRKIEVNEVVCTLSRGLFKGNTGTVMKLGKARISIKLASGRTTNRKSTNLEIVTADV